MRNRPNDVNYVYHQNPDFHYLTGYEEPDAVLLLFKEPRTVGGQPGITEALFTQPRPMDCGAEYHGYSADVTRTAPPTGTFSPAQRQIYGLVLAAQEAGFAACKPGADFIAPNKSKATQEVVASGLIRLGIIKKKEDFRRYYPHGASHYLGLDVHDRGNYDPLQAGNVITVKPGIYIPAGSPCDPMWWNIGVRIEDDVLITGTGYENLSAEAPRTVADIEKLMAEPSALEGFKLPELK